MKGKNEKQRSGEQKKRAAEKLKKTVISFFLLLTMTVTMMPAMVFGAQDLNEQDPNGQEPGAQELNTQEQDPGQGAEPVKTTITGFKKKAVKKARKVMQINVKVTAAAGRKLTLEQKVKSKWIKKGGFQTADSQEEQTISVVFPNNWWKKDSTKWRLHFEANDQSEEYISEVMKLKTKRYYQNPKKYIQIKNKISKHGRHYYTYPTKVNNASTRKQHVEAMIKAAKKYLGDPYIVCRSGKPGKGVDCSGLVMQACYAAGADLWPSNPYRHRFPKYEYESTRIARMKNLKTVPYSKAKRGDLIFYSKSGVVMHIAIYLGHGKIIHSWPGRVQISRANTGRFGYLSKVKRVFISK